MSYKVVCADCDYDPLVLNFVISAEVVAEHHAKETGHACGFRELELAF